MILEKGYAKLYQCYENIQKGFVPETIMDLTGAPYEIFRLCEDETLWKKMRFSLQKGYYVYCSKTFPNRNNNVSTTD